MEVFDKIVAWHYDRNLIEGSTDLAQFEKLLEEVMELHTSLVLGKSPKDDIGDIIVVLANIAERNYMDVVECVEHAYGDIEHRTGMMVDGVFVKDANP